MTTITEQYPSKAGGWHCSKSVLFPSTDIITRKRLLLEGINGISDATLHLGTLVHRICHIRETFSPVCYGYTHPSVGFCENKTTLFMTENGLSVLVIHILSEPQKTILVLPAMTLKTLHRTPWKKLHLLQKRGGRKVGYLCSRKSYSYGCNSVIRLASRLSVALTTTPNCKRISYQPLMTPFPTKF